MTDASTNNTWPGGLDEDEWLALGWYNPEHAAWLEKWAPRCPDGKPQRVRECLGYREREPGRLQLRVALTLGEGVCNAIVDERPDAVHVRLLVYYHEDEDEEYDPKAEYWNCPVHVYLEHPLNGRKVIDVETDREVPLYVPTWGQTGPAAA
ncbi:MAG TPA: hypothetical protein VG275_09205 [Solirubrobacteraceae bacterium]|jgi:hypothetical protein|nr:hypothetical protein [Solirubrobacteraceae bacterium]